MTSEKDLLRELRAHLRGAGRISYKSASAVGDLYEGYVFALVVDEALQRGASLHYEDVDGNKTSNLIFRTSPGQLYSRAHAYTHAVVEFGSIAPPLEVHVGVQVQGSSGVLHECDVLVLTQDEANQSRSARVAPKARNCILAIECKFYSSNLPLDLARSFQGLGTDLGEKARPTFVSNSTSGTVKRYLSHKGRLWEHSVIPGNPQVRGLREKIREAFKIYMSSKDPRYSM
ncbi:hypothetical protein SAMN05216275_1329 [Streptosporangium canum]|uniref:Uncharacterized protein n=1 Tax=Streptosporangium canum TaxID=324952 RepID=A0A1I4BJR9_9ACTN|nr:hypothetical protein SAMN05216275_1329 [Streptosporangium canum]